MTKVQTRNQQYYNRRIRDRKLSVGDSPLLLLPTEQNKLTLAWRGTYKVIGKVGEVDYRIEISPGKVKTYHINMLKRYFHRKVEGDLVTQDHGSQIVSNEVVEDDGTNHKGIHQVDVEEKMAVKDSETLLLYKLKQNETVNQ